MLRLSRRAVLAAGTALAAVPFSSKAFAAAYGGALRTRYDVASPEGQAMLAKFARAIKLMRARPTGDPLSWNFQWYTHWVPDNTTKAAEIEKLPEGERALARELWNTCRAHDKEADESLFLPWHRAYVFYFERIARKVLDDQDFALPYWDLTHPDKRALPQLFLQPATAENALYSAERKPEVNAGKPIDFQYANSSPLNADALDQETFTATDVTQGMCMALDKGVHGSVHVLVGTNKGMGAVQWAANDPIFWLLHTDMDRLWISWIRSGHTNPANDTWLDTEFAFADENGERATMRVRDCLDAEAMGYRYQRLAAVAVAAGAIEPEATGGAAAEAAPPPPVPDGNRDAAPTTGAAPPSTAPRARTAAPAPSRPGAPVQSHGPVRMGQAPVQVTLNPRTPVAPPAAAAAPRGGSDRGPAPGGAPPPRPTLQAQPPRPSKLYIVIRNLQAKAQPGVLYDVYVMVTANGQTVTARLGSINFFDAVDHNGASHGMTMQQSFVSFEVTNTLALARTPGAKLEVTIAAVGQAATNAAPVIGNISLVEKPA